MYNKLYSYYYLNALAKKASEAASKEELDDLTYAKILDRAFIQRPKKRLNKLSLGRLYPELTDQETPDSLLTGLAKREVALTKRDIVILKKLITG